MTALAARSVDRGAGGRGRADRGGRGRRPTSSTIDERSSRPTRRRRGRGGRRRGRGGGRRRAGAGAAAAAASTAAAKPGRALARRTIRGRDPGDPDRPVDPRPRQRVEVLRHRHGPGLRPDLRSTGSCSAPAACSRRTSRRPRRPRRATTRRRRRASVGPVGLAGRVRLGRSGRARRPHRPPGPVGLDRRPASHRRHRGRPRPDPPCMAPSRDVLSRRVRAMLDRMTGSGGPDGPDRSSDERRRMVERQLRQRGIADERVLDGDGRGPARGVRRPRPAGRAPTPTRRCRSRPARRSASRTSWPG